MKIKNAYVVQPSEVEPEDVFAYMVVAVVSPNGKDWAAYRQFSDNDDSIHDLIVDTSQCGDKIPKVAAEVLFPTLAVGRVYRE